MSLPLPGPADASALPDLAGFRRPRLRDDVPILWRGESSIQLGDDVVIDRVTRSHVAWMTSLDGLTSPPTSRSRSPFPRTRRGAWCGRSSRQEPSTMPRGSRPP